MAKNISIVPWDRPAPESRNPDPINRPRQVATAEEASAAVVAKLTEPLSDEEPLRPTAPGSVIQSDSLLMRTRWGNWVSDGGFIVEDSELEGDPWRLIFDAIEDAS